MMKSGQNTAKCVEAIPGARQAQEEGLAGQGTQIGQCPPVAVSVVSSGSADVAVPVVSTVVVKPKRGRPRKNMEGDGAPKSKKATKTSNLGTSSVSGFVGVLT